MSVSRAMVLIRLFRWEIITLFLLLGGLIFSSGNIFSFLNNKELNRSKVNILFNSPITQKEIKLALGDKSYISRVILESEENLISNDLKKAVQDFVELPSYQLLNLELRGASLRDIDYIQNHLKNMFPKLFISSDHKILNTNISKNSFNHNMLTFMFLLINIFLLYFISSKSERINRELKDIRASFIIDQQVYIFIISLGFVFISASFYIYSGANYLMQLTALGLVVMFYFLSSNFLVSEWKK